MAPDRDGPAPRRRPPAQPQKNAKPCRMNKAATFTGHRNPSQYGGSRPDMTTPTPSPDTSRCVSPHPQIVTRSDPCATGCLPTCLTALSTYDSMTCPQDAPFNQPRRSRVRPPRHESAAAPVAGLLFWVFVLVDTRRDSTGWELARPLLFLVGALLVSVGVAGSGVAARLAWVWPSRSKLMILAATLGLVMTCVGGFVTLRSFEFHVMPRIVVPKYEDSAGSNEAVAGYAGA